MVYTPSYAELHCHSSYSFLDGVSDPDDLVRRASELGYSGLAITDSDGVYGVVRFARAAEELGIPTVYGAELTLHLDEPHHMYPGAAKHNLLAASSIRCQTVARTSTPMSKGLGTQRTATDNEAAGVRRGRCSLCGGYKAHVVLLAKGPPGYSAICRVVSRAQLRGSKGHPIARLSDLVTLSNSCVALTGACDLSVHPVILLDVFDRSDVYLEVTDHFLPQDAVAKELVEELARAEHLQSIATNNVHHARADQAPSAQVATAIRCRATVAALQHAALIHPSPERFLKSPKEMADIFGPSLTEAASALARELAFDLRIASPNLPRFDTPPGTTEASYLRELTYEGMRERYPPPKDRRAAQQIEHELTVIESLGYAGYFLIVWDIVRFCKQRGILCQGRGSAANSAVCYALGITNADPIELDLLFERFLSPERDGPPDIDLDIEHERREEVIQYVFAKYGRLYAAQVANVITYRPKLVLRDVGKALGLTDGQIDAVSSEVAGFVDTPIEKALLEAGIDPPTASCIARSCADLADAPRHLGIHTGGIVLADRPLSEVCGLEWATMDGRSVLQWDKDDCAYMGLVKFDLLGLGMLSCIRRCLELVELHRGKTIDLARLPQEPEIYASISAADTVGVFQIESRAQMGALPRVAPKSFHDLVVQVALVRPGPIQGQSVHPYIRRRRGEEPVTYLHPLLRPALEKTLGVPIFQEQLMRIAMDAAGFTAEQADRLRQALSSKRSRQRIHDLKAELFEGMRRRGIPEAVAEKVFDTLLGFADFGFPESHAASFAYLVYASAWLRFHYPAEYLAALLNSQPMGFYSPATLIADARRHGVVVLGPDISDSDYDCTLSSACPPTSAGKPVRLGLRYVRGLGPEGASRILAARAARPFSDLTDFLERTDLDRDALESLALAGALQCFGISRRQALWKVGGALRRPRRRSAANRVAPTEALSGIREQLSSPGSLNPMSPLEETVSELWTIGASTHSHLLEHYRPSLQAIGVRPIQSVISEARHGSKVRVAGVITHRQRPSTARGTMFLNLEDESGIMNVVVAPSLLARYRRQLLGARAALVYGRIERRQGVVNLKAISIEALPLAGAPKSRDFR